LIFIDYTVQNVDMSKEDEHRFEDDVMQIIQHYQKTQWLNWSPRAQQWAINVEIVITQF